MSAVLAGFVVIGLALPVLPLHVQHGLGFNTFVVGLVAGSQFAASLLSRFWAGAHSDRHGPKRGVVIGLVGASVAGVLYLVSLAFTGLPVGRDRHRRPGPSRRGRELHHHRRDQLGSWTP
jgi:MFS family permease